MKKRIKPAIEKSERAAAKAKEALAAAVLLAKSLKTRAQTAKRRVKEARHEYKTIRKHARQAVRDKRLAQEEFDAAAKTLARLQAKVKSAVEPAA